MNMLGGLTAIKQTLDITKELRSVDARLSDAEYKLRIADLVGGLLEAKEALQDARDERRNLLEQIAELKTKLSERGNFEDENGLLFSLDENKTRIGEPYCNHCYVNTEKLFRLVHSIWSGANRYDCSHCNFVHAPRAGRSR